MYVRALCFLLAVSATAATLPKGQFTLKDSSGSVWTMQLDGVSQYVVTRDGAEAVRGTYKLAGDKIEFLDTNGPLAETGKVGAYVWKLAAKNLTFTKVSDAAQGRAATLTGGRWRMK